MHCGSGALRKLVVGIAIVAPVWPCVSGAEARNATPDNFDARTIVRAKTVEDAQRIRKALIQFVWKSDTLPNSMPDEVASAPSPVPFESEAITNTQRLTRTMEYGLQTHAYLYSTSKPKGCLLIYHSGHGELFSKELIRLLWKRVVEAGCDVIYAAMPLEHHNPKPEVHTSLGPFWLSSHAVLGLLKTDAFNPLKYFVDPVLAALNYAQQERGPYRSIFMVGLSGGGWTTTLYAALDTRIGASFPVAGSLPLSLRTFDPSSSMGDWEQAGSGIGQIADYLDLYLLATEPSRTQLQLLNVNDPCCFSGRPSELYAKDLGSMAQTWGGRFDAHLDEETFEHAVTARHSETILSTAAELFGVTFPEARPKPNPCALTKLTELMGPFASVSGRAYSMVLADFEHIADNPNHPSRSPLVLCEDDAPIGPAHTLHVHIREHGRGAYSHWGNTLVFSASDNSDPNTNGRLYRVVIDGGNEK